MFVLQSSRRGWFHVIGAALASLCAIGRRSQEIAAESAAPGKGGPERFVYTCDPRHTHTHGTGRVMTYTYDSNNKLRNIEDARCDVTTFTYDGRGWVYPGTRPPQHPSG